MPQQGWYDGFSNFNSFQDWLWKETEHLNLVTSWEVFCQVYKTLEFTDDIDDETKLAEFKDIVKDINSFFSIVRKGLSKTDDLYAALDYLNKKLSTPGVIEERKQLVYHKYKQEWLLKIARTIASQIEIEEGEERDG